MRYLFDTCAFIDAITDKDMLGIDVQAIMEDWDNELCISQETIREVLIKYKNKKVWSKYWSTAEEIIDAIIDESPFVVLPVQDEHFRTYANLDLNIIEDHKDPSDQMIISHAITNKIPLVSRDRKFFFYENQGLDLIYYGRKVKL